MITLFGSAASEGFGSAFGLFCPLLVILAVVAVVCRVIYAILCVRAKMKSPRVKRKKPSRSTLQYPDDLT
jgi:hypothetical protein